MIGRIPEWLKPFCTSVLGNDGLLDGFDDDYFIRFCSKADGTCDVYFVFTDDHAASMRVLTDAKKHDVMRMLSSMRPSRFPESVRAAIYDVAKGFLRDKPKGEENVALKQSIFGMKKDG